MNYRTIVFVIICFFAITLNAQTQYPLESENDLYWQPNVRLSFSHFQDKSDSTCAKYFEKYGFQMSSNIGFSGIVDIPESHKSKNIRKRTGFDKSYLVPVFLKNCSCILSEDTLELKVHQLLFDFAEMSARGARKELSEMQKELNTNNVNTVLFTTVINSWEEKMRDGFWGILNDVLIQKRDGAYAEWRQLTDEFLKKNEHFATRPEDINRFILDKPIEKGYIETKTIIGDLRNTTERE